MYIAYDVKSPARHPLQDPAILASLVPVPANVLLNKNLADNDIKALTLTLTD